jgi:hypothetical protein
VFEAGWGGCEHVHCLLEQFEALLAAFDESGHAQRESERSGCSPAAG